VIPEDTPRPPGRPPALFLHAKAVWDKMAEEASDTDEGLVYTGSLVRLVTKQCHLSMPYYSSVTQALRRMGCAEQLRRGGGGAPSQWVLIQPPTTELWEHASDVLLVPSTVNPSRADQHAHMINDLTQRLGKLEREFAELRDAFIESARQKGQVA
jgi:hypothetical protein